MDKITVSWFFLNGNSGRIIQIVYLSKSTNIAILKYCIASSMISRSATLDLLRWRLYTSTIRHNMAFSILLQFLFFSLSIFLYFVFIFHYYWVYLFLIVCFNVSNFHYYWVLYVFCFQFVLLNVCFYIKHIELPLGIKCAI